MERLSDHDWKAVWIGADPATYDSSALPVFRRLIQIDKPVARATARLCGLGHHELQIHGVKAGEDVLEPAWTNYAKRSLYTQHDVAPLLRQGGNELRVLLGNGMYNVTGGRYTKFKGTFGPPKLIFEMNVEFSDGSEFTIGSDESWQVAPGPITFSCIYGGEDYDARLEEPFDWRPIAVTIAPGWRLLRQQSPPIRVMRTYPPIRTMPTGDGSRVYDFGQNMSGWVKLGVQAPAGTKLTVIPGELLDANGLPEQRFTGKPVSYSYTCKGGGVETWRPRFSYTGFRYAQVIGPEPVGVEAEFIHSSARRVGQFECSSDLLNRIHALIDNAILSNFHHVLTDCPHREKLGWLEQTHLMGPGIMYNYDVREVYAKISADMRDAQHADGCIPTTAPQYTIFLRPWDLFNDSPEWGSACVINPWLVYQHYGDRQILLDNYDSMKRYVEYLSRQAKGDILAYGLGDWYDVGPGAPGFSKLTSLGLTATSIWFQDLRIMQQCAELLGFMADAAAFAALARQVQDAFHGRFFNREKEQFDTASQTASAMPLAVGLVRPWLREKVLRRLIESIRADGSRITAGDIGFPYVIDALGEHGRSDLLFDMISRSDGPSYGYQLAQGATTLTEAWDANPNVSQNHFMLGHAEIWFYRYLAGIRIDLSRQAPQQIMIKPAVVGDLKWVRASCESALGPVESSWERDASQLRMQVTIPPGASARVHVPGADSPRDVGPGTHTFESSFIPPAAS